MTTKLQLVEQPSEPKRVAAENLKPGQFLAADELTTGGPTEVLFTDTYPQVRGRETLIVHRPLGVDYSVASTVGGNRWFDLAADEQLAEFRAGVERAKKIEDIRALADMLESDPLLPMADMFGANVFLEDGSPEQAYARLRETAARIGVEPEFGDKMTALELKPGASVVYKLIAWHPDGRPAEPEPLVDPDSSMEAHYDAETDARAPHPSWPTELKPWESLAPLSDRIAESMELADPTGLAYSRADDEPEQGVQCPPECAQNWTRASDPLVHVDHCPVGKSTRVPPHTGAMTDEGLVDGTFDPGPCWHGEINPGRECPGSGPDCGPA